MQPFNSELQGHDGVWALPPVRTRRQDVARQLIEAQGGTIRAVSAGEGKGSTFIVELPLKS